ncbi:hypothetical protein BH10ACT3_BH10ACT3_11890 [soil metagenome]
MSGVIDQIHEHDAGHHRSRRRDPRAIAGGLTLAALFIGGLGAWAVTTSTRGSRISVEHVIDTIEPPMEQLLIAERSNERGQEALAAAVGATGDGRTQLLSESISAGQDTSAAWERYKASALDLPGEAQLAAQYEVDDIAAQRVSSAVLVPILNSEVPGSLPATEISTHQAVDADLRALHTLYRVAGRDALAGLRADSRRAETWSVWLSVAVLIAILAGGAFGLRRANRVRRERERRRGAQRLVAFETRLRRALELVNKESSAFKIAERGMTQMAPNGQISVLLADSSRATLTPIANGPVCGVTSPEDCPAILTTTAVAITDSDSLDACPMLTEHTPQRCSATCVPITVGGRATGVIQAVGTPGSLPDTEGAALLVARGVGERVTLLQALATFQLQAARDPLTGLLNRRSLMAAVDQAFTSGDPFAVAFCDLDHFKQLNDLHGHEAGDRALRSFAMTLTDSLRPQDIICRWGGEEFVIVLPGCDAITASEALDRVRANLVLGSMNSSVPMFTASFGVAESADADSFDDIVGCADAALSDAKAAGRDRVVRYSPSTHGRVPAIEDPVSNGTRPQPSTPVTTAVTK